MNDLASKRTAVTRCPACQLQLCKSREALPHAALKVADSNVVSYDKFKKDLHAVYTCERCSAILVNSLDTNESGWRHFRA